MGTYFIENQFCDVEVKLTVVPKLSATDNTNSEVQTCQEPFLLKPHH